MQAFLTENENLIPHPNPNEEWTMIEADQSQLSLSKPPPSSLSLKPSLSSLKPMPRRAVAYIGKSVVCEEKSKEWVIEKRLDESP